MPQQGFAVARRSALAPEVLSPLNFGCYAASAQIPLEWTKGVS